MKRSRAILVLSSLLGLIFNCNAQEATIAKKWNEQLLYSISEDFARPTVHARNLFHSSVLMYDAWAVYEPGAKPYFLGNQTGNFTCPFEGVSQPEDIIAAQEEAMSYAVYRLIKHRYATSPGLVFINNSIDSLMLELGYDINNTSTDYIAGGPAELGNYMAEMIIEFGFQDGSNEGSNFANQYYSPVNPPIAVEEPGNPTIIDPNRWQQISLTLSIDQAGQVVESTPPFLSPEWGEVLPFALNDDDKTFKTRDGDEYTIFLDPGDPFYLDTIAPGCENDPYKWSFMMVPIWQSHLTLDDEVLIDISPNSLGNVSELPETLEEFQEFYDYFDGGDPGQGYDLNPVTGQPYEPQLVRRGDYARVLAEFWADGPDSATPPGHWFKIYNTVSDHPLYEYSWMGEGPELPRLEYDVKAYFALGGAMHDAAIAAWSVKGYYDYLRPVSAVRYMADRGQCSDENLPNYDPVGVPLIPGYVEVVEEGDPLAGVENENVGKIKLYTWKGPDYIEDPETDHAGVGWILAENWWPYQRPTFVTPPFAGYVSGHSTYSRAAAELMTLLTGSAYFPGGKSGFPVEQNEFLVFEEGPSQTFEIEWATYRDASDQCSLSRIWGGIHPPIDDIPGRKIGLEIGPRAFNLADSIISIDLPRIVASTVSDEILSGSDIGASLTLTFTFDRSMNTEIIPEISFPVEDPRADALGDESIQWVNNETLQVEYFINEGSYEYNEIFVSIKSAISVEGDEQKPYLVQSPFTIDTKTPTVSFVESSQDLVNDDLIENGPLLIEFGFSEPCLTTLTPILTLEATESVEEHITYNSDLSSWLNDSTFSAVFELTDLNEEIENISVLISNVADLSGNLMMPEEWESILTLDSDNPELVEITSTAEILSQDDLGSNAILINAVFDQPMDTSEIPALLFSDTSIEELVLNQNTLNSFWVSATECQLSYDLLALGVEFFNVQFSMESFKDLAQNHSSSTAVNSLFSIDTKIPEVEITTPSSGIISDINIVDEPFYIDIEFSEPMNTENLVLVNIENEQASESILPNFPMSGWEDGFTYRARFSVVDNEIEVSDIDISISFASDVAGNSQEMTLIPSLLNLDTRNPQTLSLNSNTYDITQADIGTGTVEFLALFDEEMNEDVFPIFQFLPENVSNILEQNTDFSEWLNPYSFKGSLNVNSMDALFESVLVEVKESTDLAGNKVLPLNFEDFLSINISTLGLNSTEVRDLNIFPTLLSSGESLFFSLTSKNDRIKFALLDLNGKIVESKLVQTENGLYSTVVPDLAAGVYICQVIDESSIYTSKIMIK